MDFVAVDFPQQALDFLLDFPLAVDAHGDDAGAEEENSEDSGRDDAVEVGVGFGAKLVEEPAAGFIVGFVGAGPYDLGVGVDLVLLERRAG